MDLHAIWQVQEKMICDSPGWSIDQLFCLLWNYFSHSSRNHDLTFKIAILLFCYCNSLQLNQMSLLLFKHKHKKDVNINNSNNVIIKHKFQQKTWSHNKNAIMLIIDIQYPNKKQHLIFSLQYWEIKRQLSDDGQAYVPSRSLCKQNNYKYPAQLHILCLMITRFRHT